MFRHRKLHGYIPNNSKIVEKTFKEVPSGDGIEVRIVDVDPADVVLPSCSSYQLKDLIAAGASLSQVDSVLFNPSDTVVNHELDGALKDIDKAFEDAATK
ncbi:MAG: hypothetical protein [Microviridae sp.]|nr:MAG: hypothetical protein [Microviridae sp.]